MLRKAGEAHFTDDAQMGEYLERTVRVADDAGLTGADRAALLPAILNLLAAKQVQLEEVGVGPLGTILRPQG